MNWVKIIFLYISLLPLVVHSHKKCLDPEALTPKKFSGILHSGKTTFLNTNTHNLPLNQILLYKLSNTPMAQFVVLANEHYAMTFQLKEPVSRTSVLIKLQHNLIITVGTPMTKNDTNNQIFNDLVKIYGTSKYKAFEEMSTQCNMLLLYDKLNNEQKSMKQIELYLIIVVTLMACYCVYFLFNCIINFWTLMKIWRKKKETKCTMAICSLSQSCTSSQLSKYYLEQSEALYQDLYERMTAFGQSVQKVQEQIKKTAELRKFSICTYDYATTSYADNLGRPPQPPMRDNCYGYITPASIHDYITVVGENFCNVDKVLGELKLMVQSHTQDAQNQEGQQNPDNVDYKTSRRNTTVPSIEEDEDERSSDITISF